MNTVRDTDHDFCVIQFVILPHDGIEKYNIVPYSWVRGCTESGTLLVAYPVEHLTVTRQRVRNNEICRDDWELFEATVKHKCKIFEDAENWIATIMDELIKMGRCTVAGAANSSSSTCSTSNVTNSDLFLGNITSRIIEAPMRSSSAMEVVPLSVRPTPSGQGAAAPLAASEGPSRRTAHKQTKPRKIIDRTKDRKLRPRMSGSLLTYIKVQHRKFY